jgi:uncharacterized C2H2 Zn-finger protein
MSDKSVTKTLDWPNHRDGSKISDPIRFEEAVPEGAVGVIAEAEAAMLEVGRLLEEIEDSYNRGEIDEDEVVEIYRYAENILGSGGMKSIGKGEAGEYVDETQDAGQERVRIEPNVATQEPIEPTDLQNVTPYTQQQYMPSTTEYVQPLNEEVACPYYCDICIKEGATEDECPYCSTVVEVDEGQGGNYEQGGDIDETVEPEYDMCGYSCCKDDCSCGDCDFCEGDVDEESWERDEEAKTNECPFCGETALDPAVEGEYYCWGCGKTWDTSEGMAEEVKDPREPTDNKELSPEAQKIAGTDKKSVAAKEKARAMPKIEVDISDKITILGKTGSGKTNLIKVLISDIFPDYHYVLLDTLGNFAEYEGKPNIEYYQVTPTDQTKVDDIIYAALEEGNCMVVIDEVDRYKSKQGTMLNELVNVGRNYGVGGIFAARRTADVNKDILANSPFIFTFQHILPQDLDVLIDWFGLDEAPFRNLQEYEALLFEDGQQIWQGMVPEKPTTKPTAKPTPPKSKGKDKPKEKEPVEGDDKEKPKDKEPTPTGGEGIEKEPEAPEEAEKAPDQSAEPEEPAEEPEEGEKTEEVGMMQCPVCGKTLAVKNSEALQKHIDSHGKSEQDEGTVTCLDCGDTVAKDLRQAHGDLTGHMFFSKEEAREGDRSIDIGYYCPACEVTIEDVGEYYDHLQNHPATGKKRFGGEASVVKDEGINAFACDQCGEKYKYERDYLSHVVTHA